jgi:hypothetical protein
VERREQVRLAHWQVRARCGVADYYWDELRLMTASCASLEFCAPCCQRQIQGRGDGQATDLGDELDVSARLAQRIRQDGVTHNDLQRRPTVASASRPWAWAAAAVIEDQGMGGHRAGVAMPGAAAGAGRSLRHRLRQPTPIA